MTLGKTLSLSACNWKVMLKSFFCQVVIFAVVWALCVTMFGGVVGQIAETFQKSGVVDFINQTISRIADGTFDPSEFSDGVQGIVAAFQQAIAEVQSVWGHVEITYVLVLVVACAYRMLIAMTDVTVDFQLQEFMTSNASRPFVWYFFKKQGETWLFSLWQMLLTLPLDMTILFGCLGFYLLFLATFMWWTIIPIAFIAALLYAARLTLFAFCLPAIVTEEDKSTGEAFRYGFSTIFRRFWKVYFKTLLVVLLIVGIFTLSVLFVDNNILMTLLGVLPAFILFFWLKCINMVEYFEATDRPYFSKVIAIEGTDRYNKTHKA